jgi:hypothetical protein
MANSTILDTDNLKPRKIGIKIRGRFFKRLYIFDLPTVGQLMQLAKAESLQEEAVEFRKNNKVEDAESKEEEAFSTLFEVLKEMIPKYHGNWKKMQPQVVAGIIRFIANAVAGTQQDVPAKYQGKKKVPTQKQ